MLLNTIKVQKQKWNSKIKKDMLTKYDSESNSIRIWFKGNNKIEI